MPKTALSSQKIARFAAKSKRRLLASKTARRLTHGYDSEDEPEVWERRFSNTKSNCKPAGTVVDQLHAPLRAAVTLSRNRMALHERTHY